MTAKRAFEIRTAARQAAVAFGDDEALRESLLARPRPTRSFCTGDQVGLWRKQRSPQNKGCWFGPGVVIGNEALNLWIALGQSVVKCCPEQVRMATQEERISDEVVKKMLQEHSKGPPPRQHQRWFTVLTKQEWPPQEDADEGDVDLSKAAMIPVGKEQPMALEGGTESGKRTIEIEDGAEGIDPALRPFPEKRAKFEEAASSSSSGPAVPAEPAGSTEQVGGSSGSSSNVEVSRKRLRAKTRAADVGSPAAKAKLSKDSTTTGTSKVEPEIPAVAESEPSELNFLAMVEDAVEELEILLASRPKFARNGPQKKTTQEINIKKLSPEDRAKFMEARKKEWKKVTVEKGAVKLLSLSESLKIRKKLGHRIMQSRFVDAWKMEDTLEAEAKSRFCGKGFTDPDIIKLISAGMLQSPTISSEGKKLCLQLIASLEAEMELGDIAGAFMESDELKREDGPLYLEPPEIDGVDPRQVVLVIKPLYGLNDAQRKWYDKFCGAALSAGMLRSKFNPCLFYAKDSQNRLCGILGLHVDDSVMGGRGKCWSQIRQKLLASFPYRKLRTKKGDFCGSELEQLDDFTIIENQEKFARRVMPLKVPKGAETAVCDERQISQIRGGNGNGAWLANGTRPDLAAQVSLLQQTMPSPKVSDLKAVNQMIRRMRQHASVRVRYSPIPLDKLRLIMHHDAAWGNEKNHGTQAGYLIAFTSSEMSENKEAPWNPWVWKSLRLKRAVGSTMAGETQSAVLGQSHLMFCQCLLAEVSYDDFQLKNPEASIKKRPAICCTDCKSLWDHLHSVSTPGSTKDKRCAVDLVILREAIRDLNLIYRWIPTTMMVADALTKNAGEPQDMLRGLIKKGRYKLSDEGLVMEVRKQERERRMQVAAENRNKAEAEKQVKQTETRRENSDKIRRMAEEAEGRAATVAAVVQVPFGLDRSPRDWVAAVEAGRR